MRGEMIRRAAYWTALVLWAGMAVFLSRQGLEDTARLSGTIAAWLAGLLRGIGVRTDPETLHELVRKAAHVVIFLVLGFLVSRAFSLSFHGRWVIPAAAAVCLAAAVLDEAQKAAVPGRHCHWDEAALNAGCAMAGLALGQLVRRRTQK